MIDAMPLLEDLREAVRADERPNRQIALACGIHPNTFTAFMTGRRGLSIESIEKLSEVLGRPIQLAPPAKKGGKR